MIKNYIFLDGKWFSGHRPVRAHGIYRSRVLDLLSGEVKVASYLDSLDEWLSFGFSERLKQARFAHLFYELGTLLVSNESVADDELLAIFVDYETIEALEVGAQPLSFKLVEAPEYSLYECAFNRGYEHLLKGDCYQFNLTYPYLYHCERPVDALQFIGALKSSSAYAHAADFDLLKLSIFSNSPESLFEREGKQTLVTKPIKGTVPSGQENLQRLKGSRKDLAELDMITDLLRNDLNRIDRPTAKVRARHEVMEVPGLYHQYSEVELTFEREVSMSQVVRSLFPSGSVTGAPKKRSMEILRQLEQAPRRIYCGTTLFCFGETVRASVNIRTALYDHSSMKLEYHAGGGCTLLSKAQDEFAEMNSKVRSFFSNLRSPF